MQVSSPPSPRLVLHVGVTGHRPSGLQGGDDDILRSKIREVLSLIAGDVEKVYKASPGIFSSLPPILRLISPLAEGADRIVAEEALGLGYELQCPLPFELSQYEQDFDSSASLTEFSSLLSRATTIFELDGDREQRRLAYQEVGRTVLSQSDILVAIWNGKEPQGQGGTGEIVQEAIQRKIPTCWIQAQKPHLINLLGYSGKRERPSWNEGLPQYISNLLSLPALNQIGYARNKEKSDLSQEFFSETECKINVGFPFKLFRDLLGGMGISRPKFRMPGFEEETLEEWQEVWNTSPGLPSSLIDQINRAFLLKFAWADKLANYYADLYRSSFIVNYFLSGCAVLAALLAYPLELGHAGQEWLVLTEIILISFIILTTWYGKRKRWHERWIDYRFLAEQLRQMRFLAPLGILLPSFSIPAHHANNDLHNNWINWYFRASAREAGLPNVRIDQAYLEAGRTLLTIGEVEGQIHYHEINASRFHILSHRLHHLGLLLFALTGIACLSHLYYHGEYSRWLTLLSGVLPAFGAAFAGILFQGEFQRLAQRSEAMTRELGRINNNLTILPELSHENLCLMANEVANIMITEVLDWRILLHDRPLNLPG